MYMLKNIYRQIMNTIGSIPPESGGIGILDSICYDVVLFEKVIQEFRNIRIEESRCG